MKVILDPGHGFPDPGAIGSISKESDICLEIALVIEKHLNRHNVPVDLTRRTSERIHADYNKDLNYRPNFAQEQGATHFLSIHMNAFKDALVRGTEIFVSYTDANGFALDILESLVDNHNFVNRGLKQRNFRVLGNPLFKSALLEIEFITNKHAELYVLKNIESIGESVARGILRNLGVEWKVDMDWKDKIIREAHKLGLIQNLDLWLRGKDKPMPTWAVLQVAINVLKGGKDGR